MIEVTVESVYTLRVDGSEERHDVSPEVGTFSHPASNSPAEMTPLFQEGVEAVYAALGLTRPPYVRCSGQIGLH